MLSNERVKLLLKQKKIFIYRQEHLFQNWFAKFHSSNFNVEYTTHSNWSIEADENKVEALFNISC